MSHDLASALADVYWLGGSSCAGKTTVAARLGASLGIEVYHCDDHFDEHATRANPRDHPSFVHIASLSPEALWMRPVEVQVAELYAFYDEEFDMVVADLHSDGGTRIVEGAGLRPGRVAPLLANRDRALWLVTGAAFRRAIFPGRGDFVAELLARCADPGTAFENWMQRDEERATRLREELTSLGLPFIEIDGSHDVDTVTDLVRAHFGFDA